MLFTNYLISHLNSWINNGREAKPGLFCTKSEFLMSTDDIQLSGWIETKQSEIKTGKEGVSLTQLFK